MKCARCFDREIKLQDWREHSMTKGPLVSRKEAGWLFLFLAVLLVVGSFFDAPISRALYNESSLFGSFFAAYGEYPAMLGFVAAGALLVIGHNRKRKVIGILQILSGAVLAVYGGLMACMLPTLYLTWPVPVIAFVGVICSAGTAAGLVWLCKNAPREEIIRVAAVIFFTILAELVLINLIKIPWGRPRMRLIARDPRATFMPWWQPGGELKNLLVAAGVAAEEFKSFPSGHAGNAVMLMLLGLLPRLNGRLAGKRCLLVGIGFIWACVVAFSRIIMGAHYLTDTVVGFAVGLACLLLVNRLVFRREVCPSQ